MKEFGTFGDVTVGLDEGFIAIAEIHRAPNNFFDASLIASIAEAFEALDAEGDCRAIVLCSEGKHFCAGAQLTRPQPGGLSDAVQGEGEAPRHLYEEAVRLFATQTPVVAAIQGAAIGGGLGLALMPDFRVAAPEARFAANFSRLGLHHGFGMSVTLPALVGQQRAMELLYTGKRIRAEEALEIGLCDRLVPADELRGAAAELAREIASSAPLAVRSIRETLRGDLPARIRAATDRERAEQERLEKTQDFREGVRSMAKRRPPEFTGS